MAQVFRHASVYYRGKKVAMFSGFEEQIQTGAEDVISIHGWEGASAGPVLVRLSTDAIIPVSGIGVPLIRDMLNDEYVDIGLGSVGGDIHKIKMRIAGAVITSEAASGTLRGKFEFIGGKPEVVTHNKSDFLPLGNRSSQ